MLLNSKKVMLLYDLLLTAFLKRVLRCFWCSIVLNNYRITETFRSLYLANSSKLWKNVFNIFGLFRWACIKRAIKSWRHNNCNIPLVQSTLGSSMLCMTKISHFVCGSAINVEEQAPNVPCLEKIKGIFKIYVRTCTHTYVWVSVRMQTIYACV